MILKEKKMKLSTIEQTMTSVDIATLTEKRHNDVLRDIREMFNGLEIDARTFARVYLGGNNQQRPMYELDRELTHCLLTGYSAKARMKVIKRWHELEKGKTPTTFIEALELTLEQAKAIEEKEKQLELQKPKVQLAEALFEVGAEMTFREFINVNGLREQKFKNQLVEDRLLYIDQLTHAKLPYAHTSEWFKVRNEFINGGVRAIVMIKPAGAEYLVTKYLPKLDDDCFK